MTTPRQEQLNQKQIFISCIVPVYNEEAIIEPFLQELSAQISELTHHYEIIVINDGSHDRTENKITPLLDNLPIKLINFSRNFGKELALTAGLEHAAGEVVILIDGDFEHPISLIPTFLTRWAQGHDMVYGIRVDRSRESWPKQLFSRLFYKIMGKIGSVHMPHDAGDFRLLDRKIVTALNQFDERERLMKGLYAWVGFKHIGIPFTPSKRKGGQTSWNPLKLFNLAVTGIISFSDVPLRLCSLIGSIISAFSFIFSMYIVADTLLFGAKLPGFATLIVAITFLGGIQLIFIGILGEYIARIFTEVKHRPKYIIETKKGFDASDQCLPSSFSSDEHQ